MVFEKEKMILLREKIGFLANLSIFSEKIRIFGKIQIFRKNWTWTFGFLEIISDFGKNSDFELMKIHFRKYTLKFLDVSDD